MREVAKGLYTVEMPNEAPRMWHDCTEDKNRRKHRQSGKWRPELVNKGKGKFECEHCGFKYPA